MVLYTSIFELSQDIKHHLESNERFSFFSISGEISNFKRHSKGHLYFSLKDDKASLSAMMFLRQAMMLNFSPKEGDHVLVTGKISFYEPSGQISIQVQEMQLAGLGALYQKYEALKKELMIQGIFDECHKKKIPQFPKKIAVVTSETGAVIQDILNTVARRYPLVEIVLFPSLVQGADAAKMLVQKIRQADQYGADTLIIGRGGGSIEDLWCFNEREVVLAIYEAKTPIITAIGHETDTTLSDFAADMRAPTPTAAAEIATPSKDELLQTVLLQKRKLTQSFVSYMDEKKTAVLYLDHRLMQQSPSNKIREFHQRIQDVTNRLKQNSKWYLESLKQKVAYLESKLVSPYERIKHIQETNKALLLRLDMAIKTRLDTFKHQLALYTSKLELNSPYKIMDKGYVFVETSAEKPLSFDQIKTEDIIYLRFKEGKVKTQVMDKKENKNG